MNERGPIWCALFILISATLAVPANAQLGNTVRTILNGDSLAPLDHDTAYIANYRNNIVISVLTRYQLVDVDLEQNDGGEGLSYSTNTNSQYGFGVNYKWLSVEATFNVPALDNYDPAYGKTTSRGFGLGYTGRRLWMRAFWSNTEGYFLNDPDRWIAGRNENDPPVLRSDLGTNTYLLSANYALSRKKRYSQNAALFQLERQKRSSGTFVVGLSTWRTIVNADISIIGRALLDTFNLEMGFTELRRTLINATIGYTHTFVFWHKGFFNIALMPGISYVQQAIVSSKLEEQKGSTIASATELKVGAGFNGDRWYCALTTSVYYSTTPIADKLSVGTNYVFARFALGLRLAGPKSGVLQKLGL